MPRGKIIFCLTQPKRLLRNECTSVCPDLNHIRFIKLESGFEPSDALVVSQVSLTAHREMIMKSMRNHSLRSGQVRTLHSSAGCFCLRLPLPRQRPLSSEVDLRDSLKQRAVRHPCWHQLFGPPFADMRSSVAPFDREAACFTRSRRQRTSHMSRRL